MIPASRKSPKQASGRRVRPARSHSEPPPAPGSVPRVHRGSRCALVGAVRLVRGGRYRPGALAAAGPWLLVCRAVSHPGGAAAGIGMVVVSAGGLPGHGARGGVVGALMRPVVAAGVLLTSHRL